MIVIWELFCVQVTTSPDSESCSSDEESNYPSVTDCSSNDIDGKFLINLS